MPKVIKIIPNTSGYKKVKIWSIIIIYYSNSGLFRHKITKKLNSE